MGKPPQVKAGHHLSTWSGAGTALPPVFVGSPCARPREEPGGAEGPQNMQVTWAVHPRGTSSCPHGAEGKEPSQGLLLLRFPPRKETRAAISTRWL